MEVHFISKDSSSLGSGEIIADGLFWHRQKKEAPIRGESTVWPKTVKVTSNAMFSKLRDACQFVTVFFHGFQSSELVIIQRLYLCLNCFIACLLVEDMPLQCYFVELCITLRRHQIHG